LSQVLGYLAKSGDARLLVGFETNDDAGVFQITPELALVQSVDFFTPMVDDPYAFGAIAAANALSDIYAMGATPLTALNILAYPTDVLPLEMLAKILQGGADKAAEAGVTLLGGHTVEDDVPKYGMSVTGTVHPERIVRNVGGRSGDRLILTKPIGVGILATAIKRGLCSRDGELAAIASMSALNKAAGSVLARLGAHACTDITGFGLLGHLYEMIKGSAVGAVLSFAAVPIFAEALTLAQQGEVPGGTKRNLDYLAPHLRFAPEVDLPRQLLLADAQTSGGLLFAVAPEQGDALIAALKAADCGAWEIGHLVAGSGIEVTI
jgi:selenide,water dikinase